MKFNYELSSKVKDFLESAELKEIGIGCSDSQVFEIKKNNETFFIKMASEGLLTKEYKALKWLEGKLEVPKVVLYDVDNNTEFLITEAIAGEMVCSKNMLENPDLGIKIIVQAFKKIISVDIANCPMNVALDYKLNLVKTNVKQGLIDYNELPEDVKEKFNSLEEIIKYLDDNRFEEELVFSHGDTSLPNIFCLNNNFSGFIDVGECGIADKWFDLAICQKSIVRNFGKEYVEKFYEELGITPDYHKIEYYLLMMQLYL